MDIFLIIISCVVGILLIGVNFYLLALYCHPDDNGFGASLFCKVLVVLGLTLSWAQVLLMPLDIANNQGLQTGNLDMKLCWYIIYMSIMVMVFGLLPYAQYFYETDDEKTLGRRLLDAAFMEFCTLAIVIILLVIGYSFLSTADIPVHTVSLDFSTASTSEDGPASANTAQITDITTLSLPVSFPIFAMGFMAFIGWFLFVCFGGVGLSALPLDLINEFIDRPKLMTTKDAVAKRSWLKKKTVELIESGNKIKGIIVLYQQQDEDKEANYVQGFWAKRKQKGKAQSEYKKFKQAVICLDNEYEIFKLELEYMNTNPVVYYLKLFFGVIFIFVSICWWFQILLYMVLKNSNGFPFTSFLNQIFLYFEYSVVSFLGTILLAFFCIYLLWATQKGNLKFGMRIPFLFTIHPMKYNSADMKYRVNETWMNTFLFNVSLILMASVSVTQFCCQAFGEYTRNSELALIFQQQVRYLGFFSYFFDNLIFEYTLLGWSALVAIYLIVKPSDKPRVLQLLEQKQAEKKEIELKSK